METSNNFSVIIIKTRKKKPAVNLSSPKNFGVIKGKISKYYIIGTNIFLWKGKGRYTDMHLVHFLYLLDVG